MAGLSGEAAVRVRVMVRVRVRVRARARVRVKVRVRVRIRDRARVRSTNWWTTQFLRDVDTSGAKGVVWCGLVWGGRVWCSAGSGGVERFASVSITWVAAPERLSCCK